MRNVVILALLASAMAQGQSVAAGARALVSSDRLPVYASMSDTAEVKATLTKGETVIIGLVLFGDNTTWCALSRVGQSRRLGFASCEFLEPDRGPNAAVEAIPAPPPVPAQPPPAKSKPKPVTIREVAKPPVTVHEVPSPHEVVSPTPAPVDLPAPKPAAEPATGPIPEPATATPPATPVAVPDPEPALPPPTTVPVREPEPAASQTDFVELLLEASGLRSSLANYTQRTNLLSFLDKGRLAELELPTLQRTVSRWFQPGAFYKAIGGQAQKNYSPDRLPELVEWLRSPVTTRMASLERRAFSPDAREELVAFADALRAAPPSQPRLVLIHRLYDAFRTCDMEVETTIALVHTVAQTISPALPKEKRYTAAELDRALGTVKSRYRSIMKNARIVHYLFAYQPISDEELEQYVSFLESDNGKWLISLVDKGFFEATESIARGLRTDIPRNVKPKRRLPGENTAKGLLP